MNRWFIALLVLTFSAAAQDAPPQGLARLDTRGRVHDPRFDALHNYAPHEALQSLRLSASAGFTSTSATRAPGIPTGC